MLKVEMQCKVVACEKASEWQQALGLFEQMKAKDRDSITCATLISACERASVARVDEHDVIIAYVM